MIKFGFENYETEFPNWSKHHRKLSIRVKRVCEDGRVIETENKDLLTVLESHSDKLLTKAVSLYDREFDKLTEAVDYYLPLFNLEYKESDIGYYDVGASNTSQTTFVRLKFLIEDNIFSLDYEYKTSGSHAMSFKSFLGGFDFVEDIIESVLSKGLSLEECGISVGDSEDYLIVVSDRVYNPESFEISKHDLFEGLVCVEVYDFDMKIDD